MSEDMAAEFVECVNNAPGVAELIAAAIDILGAEDQIAMQSDQCDAAFARLRKAIVEAGGVIKSR
jgi:hypothetical protein